MQKPFHYIFITFMQEEYILILRKKNVRQKFIYRNEICCGRNYSIVVDRNSELYLDSVMHRDLDGSHYGV